MGETMEFWSGSDTPELFEDEGPINTDEQFAVIDCMFDEQHQNRLDLLQSGFLSRLLSAEVEAFKQDEQMIYIFDRPFVNKSLFIPKLRNSLFKCVRSVIFQLMRKATDSLQAANEDDLQKARREIRRMIYFCNETISKHTYSDVCDVQKDLVNDFLSLSNSLGTLSDLVNLYSLSKIKKDMILHALFHIQLELHIHRVMLIFKYLVKDPSETATDRLGFTKSSTMLVHDLLSLSYHIYNRLSTSCKSIWEEDFFLCVCIKQVWVTLIHIINQYSKTFNGHSFWSVLSTVLQHNNFEGPGVHSESEVEFSVEFKVWVLCSLAPLYWIDPSGNNRYNNNNKSVVTGNWQLIQELVKPTSSEDTGSSSSFRSILWSCVCLTKHWDPDLNVFHTIWNFISKNMNTVKKHETQHLDTYFKTVYSLSEKFESIMSYLADSLRLDIAGSNFECFLRYLVVTIKRLKSKNELQLISQFKGKIYSKFHKHSINKMNTTGLERFTTLFTVLALVVGIEEIPKKMIVYVSLLQFNQQSMEMRKIIIQSVFLSLMVCKKQELPADNIIQKVTSLFKSLITMLRETKMKKEHYSQSWDLLCFYLDCVEQCFDYTILIPDEGQLICSVYTDLLSMTSDSQKKKIFVHLISLLSSSYLQQPNLSSRDYDLVWTNIHLPLSKLVDDRNSKDLAEIFASLSMLSLKRLSLTERQHFDLLLNNYGFSDNVSTSCKCFYISHILSSSAAVEKIKELKKSNDLVKVWITCIMQDLHKVSNVIMDLTRSIINSPGILHWVPQIECTQAEHVETILFQYISHLGKKHSSLSTLNEITDFRKTINLFFSNFITIAENIIFHGTCEKSMVFMIKVAGHLVESCAKCIYSKSSPSCILPRILDIFVLPFTSSKKPSPSVLLKTLKMHLSLFLSGLATLDISTDIFLNRKIKEIMNKYFLEFCIRSTKESKKNPFLAFLHQSFIPSPTKHATESRTLMLEHIREYFLYIQKVENSQLKTQPPEQLMSVLNFILELVTNTSSQLEIVNTMKILSMKMVTCILLCDRARNSGNGEPRDIRKYAMNVLRKMYQNADMDTKEVLRGLLQKFISDNLGRYQLKTMLRTMQSICLLSTSVVKSLLPHIETLILEEEKKRGTGTDGALRQSLRELKLFMSSITND